jgi:formylglycine-generating enzyme required for sulfatase activity
MGNLVKRAPRAFLIVSVLALILQIASEVHRNIQISAEYAAAPEGMVLVPAGYFRMGSSMPGVEADEEPARDAFTAAFYIDQYEITNAQFQAFDASHRYPPGRENWPVTAIHKHRAEAYAAHYGKRLPTAAEWEKAARGTDGRRYPWGDSFEPANCNTRAPGVAERGLQAIGSFPRGISPYGCHDMSGNAWEWVSDVHTEGGLLDPRGKFRRGILKGGAHGYSAYQARGAYNGFEDESTTCNDVGFRCAKDARPN